MQQEHRPLQGLREDTGNKETCRTLLERDKRLTKLDNMVWYRELLATADVKVYLKLAQPTWIVWAFARHKVENNFSLKQKLTEILFKTQLIP